MAGAADALVADPRLRRGIAELPAGWLGEARLIVERRRVKVEPLAGRLREFQSVALA